ncbi:4'-phosphopantetheinyl transferase family protein [Kiloniella sp. b19]|uniref:4'-phosphopantetheinyl transferase family protein n=1 Tax=Kiloniella sp. GXU_MW_B19 TaxID=3141326 RepID=UPI0031D10A88
MAAQHLQHNQQLSTSIRPAALQDCGPDGLHRLPLNCPVEISPWPESTDDCLFIAMRFDKKLTAPRALDLPDQLQNALARRQREFIAGRLCAAEAIQKTRGQKSFPTRNPDGSPSWPEGLTGSITHSHNLAIAAVGPSRLYRGIGVDLERTILPEELPAISSVILGQKEQALWSRQMNSRMLTLLFSAKESLFKALYPDIPRYSDFKSSELFRLLTPGTGLLRLTEDLSPRWASGHVVPFCYQATQDLVLTSVRVRKEQQTGCMSSQRPL